jgi:hypothetical protein
MNVDPGPASNDPAPGVDLGIASRLALTIVYRYEVIVEVATAKIEYSRS